MFVMFSQGILFRDGELVDSSVNCQWSVIVKLQRGGWKAASVVVLVHRI